MENNPMLASEGIAHQLGMNTSSLLSPAFTVKILLVNTAATQSMHVFDRHAIVLVTLNDPREKFWGAILDLTAAGVSLRGIDLNSFEDFAQSTRAEDPI